MDNPDDRVYKDGEEVPDPMGYWVIGGSELLRMLRRVKGGEDPDLVYAEEYANSEIEQQ